jgi:two-component system OmpR family response regulator
MPNPLANMEMDQSMATLASILVADDDPASCRFFCDGLRSLGAKVEACTDGVKALARAREDAFDLLLLDCRMPGAGALEVLTELHRDAAAKSGNSIAVATTAELDPGDRVKLQAAGFSEILIKPCSLSDLQRILSLTGSDLATTGMLDDSAALTASGDTTTMRALRLLLREELVQLEQDLDPLGRDQDALSERLHRLRSSCGFCGATALSAQTILLQQQLADTGARQPAIDRFRQALSKTLMALDG